MSKTIEIEQIREACEKEFCTYIEGKVEPQDIVTSHSKRVVIDLSQDRGDKFILGVVEDMLGQIGEGMVKKSPYQSSCLVFGSVMKRLDKELGSILVILWNIEKVHDLIENDDFFSVIRSLFGNVANTNFCLIGKMEVNDLIKNNLRPAFNICKVFRI